MPGCSPSIESLERSALARDGEGQSIARIDRDSARIADDGEPTLDAVVVCSMRAQRAMFTAFVVSFALPASVAAQTHARPLPCAGHSLTRTGRVPREILREHPDLRPGGVSVRCDADSLTLLEWGNDSSSRITVPRERALRVWRRFVASRTYEISYRVFFEVLAAEAAAAP